MVSDEDEFTLGMIDGGAEEVEKVGDSYEVTGPMSEFGAIQEKLQELSVTPDEASLVRVPVTRKAVEDEDALTKLENLLDKLSEDDDVVTVYHNLEE